MLKSSKMIAGLKEKRKKERKQFSVAKKTKRRGDCNNKFNKQDRNACTKFQQTFVKIQRHSERNNS